MTTAAPGALHAGHRRRRRLAFGVAPLPPRSASPLAQAPARLQIPPSGTVMF
ncbi:MAG: hypothetical protein R2856_32470 [Caldilineaceae bacterium]